MAADGGGESDDDEGAGSRRTAGFRPDFDEYEMEDVPEPEAGDDDAPMEAIEDEVETQRTQVADNDDDDGPAGVCPPAVQPYPL